MEIRISDELNDIIRYARDEAMRTGSYGVGIPFLCPFHDPLLASVGSAKVGRNAVEKPWTVFLRVFHYAPEQFPVKFAGAVDQ